MGYECFTRLRVTKGFQIEEVVGNCAIASEYAIVQPFASSDKVYFFKVSYKPSSPKVAVTGDIMPVVYTEPDEPCPKSLVLQVR